MASLSLDSERATKLETALKDQVELIGHVNDRVKQHANQQESLTEQIDQICCFKNYDFNRSLILSSKALAALDADTKGEV